LSLGGGDGGEAFERQPASDSTPVELRQKTISVQR